MKFQKSKIGLKFTTIYVALVIAAIVFYLNVGNDGLSSLYIMILTFPWSYLETILWVILGVMDSVSEFIKILTLIFYAIINTFVLYYLISMAEKAYLEVIIEEPTDFLKTPNDKDLMEVLDKGEIGRIIHSRYYKGLRYYKIRLNDGREGYVKNGKKFRIERKRGQTNFN
jgi:hypothetical protein